jgi:hypothetical protein
VEAVGDALAERTVDEGGHGGRSPPNDQGPGTNVQWENARGASRRRRFCAALIWFWPTRGLDFSRRSVRRFLEEVSLPLGGQVGLAAVESTNKAPAPLARPTKN